MSPSRASQRLLLEKGDVDMARNLTADQIKGLAGNSDVVVNTYPSADTYYMALNQKDEHLAEAAGAAGHPLADRLSGHGQYLPQGPVHRPPVVLAVGLLRLL